MGMIASTAFFFAEAATVHSHWKTSLHVGALVTLVAGVHYMYMREYWVQVHKSPIGLPVCGLEHYSPFAND